MTRMNASVLSLALLLSVVPLGSAGPACVRRNWKAADCVEKCSSRFGYTGMAMGMDPWGSVMKPVEGDMDSYMSEACGLATASSSSAPPLATQPVANVQSQVSIATVVAQSTDVPAPLSASAGTVASSVIFAASSSAVPSQTSDGLETSSTPAPEPETSSAPPPAATTDAPPPAPTTDAPPPPQTTSTPAPPPPQTTADSGGDSGNSGDNSGGSSGGTSDSDISAYLDDHNSVRSQHGASPLTWSNDLAAKAQQWANNCKFVHSGGTLGPFGENLAAGTGSSYGIGPAIQSWADEASQYDSSNPVASHFTQMVWKASTQVGCALAMCNGIFAASFGEAQFYVCEYSPQGNVIGEFAQNVQA